MKFKYYVAIIKKSNCFSCDIIRINANVQPEKSTFPQYAYMFGGYSTRKKALQVAMYQNYKINSPEQNQHTTIVNPV